MSGDNTYDAIVIGSGPGGYVAAIRLGQLEQRTLLVEREYVGGVCLNWGCIPSKALIAASGLVDKLRRAEIMGITTAGLNVDVGKMQSWKDGIVSRLTGGVRNLVKGSGGTIVMGEGKLTGPRSVDVTKEDGSVESYQATKGIIVATGAEPIRIPGFDTDGEVLITAREAVSLQHVPKTLLLIGGGIIGMELGMVYQKLGSRVIVVELMDQLLPGVDLDMVKVVQQNFKKAGGEVLLQARATDCQVRDGKARVRVDYHNETREIEADKVLVAVGFRPLSKSIGLEAAGVATDERGHLITNELIQTNVPGIYAIGDVSGPPYLAHKASKEGEIAAEVIAGHKAARDWRAMPAAIFTDPEIATVGLSETEARRQGRDIKIGKFPFAVSGRAMAVNETHGFVKTIIDAKGKQLLGVGIVGPEASDLIAEGALALEMCAFAEDVGLTVHPHPTLSESVMESFKHAVGEAIHIRN
ncbi:MAG: dihydrolipoyl dehydrogenase [Proteobacteria bacterium]|nr:dihydrolipoyl dehydrogenase [Pseudomonadota bacterium]